MINKKIFDIVKTCLNTDGIREEEFEQDMILELLKGRNIEVQCGFYHIVLLVTKVNGEKLIKYFVTNKKHIRQVGLFDVTEENSKVIYFETYIKDSGNGVKTNALKNEIKKVCGNYFEYNHEIEEISNYSLIDLEDVEGNIKKNEVKEMVNCFVEAFNLKLAVLIDPEMKFLQ